MARHDKVTGYVTSRMIAGRLMWLVRLNYGPSPTTGKRVQPWDDQRYGTEKEADRRLAVLLNEKNSGQRDDPSRRTMGELITEWLDHGARDTVADGTLEDYETICRVHLQPAFGAQQASKITTAQLERWRHAKLTSGATKHMVSRCTLHLGQAFKYGIRHGYVQFNPVSALQPLHKDHREMKFLTADESMLFIEATAGHSYSPLWSLAIKTGMRKGELVGLRWTDIDFEHSVLHVRRALSWVGGFLVIHDVKNRQARTINIDKDMLEILRIHQAGEEARKQAARRYWMDEGYVCASNVGTAINPYNISRVMGDMINLTGTRGEGDTWAIEPVQRVCFHDLRHTCASLLLSAGVPVHVVSRQLGHSSAAITLRIYAHVMPGQGADAAEILRKTLQKTPLIEPTAPLTAPRKRKRKGDMV